LPYWLGSTFRGGLGQHLSRSVCLEENCPYCRESYCLFSELYKPRPEKRGHTQPPKAVIIIPPFLGRSLELRPGANINIQILVLGDYVKSFFQLIFGMISFGEEGIGPDRHYGKNKFQVKRVKCLESGDYVLKDSKVDSTKFTTKDIDALEPLCTEEQEVEFHFKTPFTGAFVPRTLSNIIRLTRNRLILFVNEYGSGETIPTMDKELDDLCCKVELKEIRRHILLRKSSRSEKDRFIGWTGSISIGNISHLPLNTRWLLACSSVIGMGPDSSFGAGFIEIANSQSFKEYSTVTGENL
jgi:hypothetical protein